MTCLLQGDDVAASGESQSSHMVMENLVAKQQARRKPKGLKKTDEHSEHPKEREKEKNIDGRLTDKDCLCRHQMLLSQFQRLLFAAAARHSLHLHVSFLLRLIDNVITVDYVSHLGFFSLDL